jgi:hypothetical protein
MFPPEPGAETGGFSGARVRRVGRRGRPLSLVVAVLLFAAFWVCSAGMAGLGVAHDPHGRAGGVAGIAFWTVAFALVMWRVWRGGRMATLFMARIGTMLGMVFLLGMVAFAVLLFTAPPGGSALKSLVYLLPVLLAGIALLAAGILLRRREVSQWGGF